MGDGLGSAPSVIAEDPRHRLAFILGVCSMFTDGPSSVGSCLGGVDVGGRTLVADSTFWTGMMLVSLQRIGCGGMKGSMWLRDVTFCKT